MVLDDLEVRPLLTVAQLEDLHRRHRADRAYVRTAAEAVASGSAALERAGAWLLRRTARDGGGLPAEDWAIVDEALAGVRSWYGRLILCQLMSENPRLVDSAPREAAGFLRDCVGDPKPTVRAWAVSTFHDLGRRHPGHRVEARRIVAAARRDPAPCMRARLRHLG